MLRGGVEHDMCIQGDQPYSGQFTSGQCLAGGRLMGWPATVRKVYTRPKRHNSHEYFNFAFECESSERVLFLLLQALTK